MADITLTLLTGNDWEQFIFDNQRAFKYGAMEEFGERDSHFEEDGEIISRKTIENSIDHGVAYRIRENGRIVGGLVLQINEKTKHNHLDLLFVSPTAHSKGIGTAVAALKDSIGSITRYDEETALRIREAEEKTDHLEDILGTYLVKLTSTQLGENESAKATEYMKVIGDYERIADHAVNILESAEELVQKGIVFSDQAQKEYNLISDAVEDILDLSHTAFKDTDLKAARKTEPLEQIVDELKETLRTRHILRLQKGECSVDAGFVWSDLLTNLERVADHCSNISGCVLDTAGHTMNIHQNQRLLRNSGEDFGQELQELRVKYKI